MNNSISYTRTVFSMIAFFDEDDNELLEIQGIVDEHTARVPNIGEHIILASYEGDSVNDKKPIFRNFYKVVDVFTHYSENKRWENVSVQYSVILKKEESK